MVNDRAWNPAASIFNLDDVSILGKRTVIAAAVDDRGNMM